MEIKPNSYLESAEWVDRIERELMGINSPEETRILTDELARSTDLAEAIGIIRLSRRGMAKEMMQRSIRLAMESGPQPSQPAPPDHWRKPAAAAPIPMYRRRIGRLAALGSATLLVIAAVLFYVSVRDDRPPYVSLTSAADTARVRQIVDEQLVGSYLIAETKGTNENRLDRARQLMLTSPVATDSVLALLANVKDDATFEVSFLRGYALLQDARKNPVEAVAALQLASRSSDPRIREEAQWYLALAYLSAMDLASAYPLFTQIAASSSGHRRYAQAVVDALTRH